MLNDQTSRELELVRRVQRGDTKAQYTLYKQYVDAMYHTVVRIVRDSEEAHDVVQECFVKVFQNIRHYRAESTIGAWIKRIAVNAAINTIRKRQRSLEFYVGDITETYGVVDYELAEDNIAPKQVHDAIKDLPSGCRTVINLYAFEGYSHKEIAQILEIKESTSKTQYRRAKQLLRNSLQNKYYNHES